MMQTVAALVPKIVVALERGASRLHLGRRGKWRVDLFEEYVVRWGFGRTAEAGLGLMG